jgi:hypothetical protein
VNKAAPVVTITGGTFTYDKLPHSGIGRATGVLGDVARSGAGLYNDTSQTPPVGAGFNWVSRVLCRLGELHRGVCRQRASRHQQGRAGRDHRRRPVHVRTVRRIRRPSP